MGLFRAGGVVVLWIYAARIPMSTPVESSYVLKQFHVVKQVTRKQILAGVFVQDSRPAFCGTEWGWEMHPLDGSQGSAGLGSVVQILPG